ncbi:kelch domain-containing protein 3 [Balamuthia mandrillaris]
MEHWKGFFSAYYVTSAEGFCLFRELDPELAAIVFWHLLSQEEAEQQKRTAAACVAGVCHRFRQLIQQDPKLHIYWRRFCLERCFKQTSHRVGDRHPAPNLLAAVSNQKSNDHSEQKLLVLGGGSMPTMNVMSLGFTRRVEVIVHVSDAHQWTETTTYSAILLALLQTLRLSTIENYVTPAGGQLLLFDTAPDDAIGPEHQKEAFCSRTGEPLRLKNCIMRTVKTSIYPRLWTVASPLLLGCLPGKGHKASDQVIAMLTENDGGRIIEAMPKGLGRVTLETRVWPEFRTSIHQHHSPPQWKCHRVPRSFGVGGLCLLDESGTRDRFFVFGGFDTEGQVCCWNVEEAQWDASIAKESMPASPNFTWNKGSREQAPSVWTPGRREGHSLVGTGGRYLWVFGGRQRDQHYFNDLAVFDTHTLTWRKVEAKNPPSIRAYHSAIAWQDKIFVFGGATVPEKPESEDTKVLNDVHVFDTKDEEAGWQQVETKGVVPQARARHAASESHGYMVVTGGCTNATKTVGIHNSYFPLESIGDCLALDLRTMEWTEIPHKVEIYGHCQVVINDILHIVGGYLGGSARKVSNTQPILLQLTLK